MTITELEGKPASKKTPAKTAGRTVRLAQHIHFQSPSGPVRLQAGQTYPVGKKAGQIDPDLLQNHPLLDLDHADNQASVARRRALLDEIQTQQRAAQKASQKLAEGVGQPRRRVGLF